MPEYSTRGRRRAAVAVSALVLGMALGLVLAVVTTPAAPSASSVREAQRASTGTPTPLASPAPPAPNSRCPYTPVGEPADSFQEVTGGSSRTGKGVRLTVSVLTDDTCLPAAGMIVDIWHEGPDGQYSSKYRFQGLTGPDGQVTYWTSPVLLSGEGQPHIHIRVRNGDGADIWTSVPMPGKRAKVLTQIVVHSPSTPLPQV